MQAAIGTNSPGEPRDRTRARILLFALLAVCFLLALASSSALALSQRGYVVGKTFGTEGSGAGQLRSPQGVAYDAKSGDIYVVDAGNNRVDRFGPDGVFKEAWGIGVKTGGKAYEQCTTECKAGLKARGRGGLHGARDMAIDNDPGSPSYGDIYVEAVTPYEEGEKEFESVIIDKYSPEGAVLSLIKGIEAGEVFEEEPHGIAVSPLGMLLVYNEEEIFEFTNEVKNKFIREFESEIGEEPELRHGIATDAVGNVYLGYATLPNDPTGPTWIAKTAFGGEDPEVTTVVNASLDPFDTSGIAVDPKTQNLFFANGNKVAMTTPEGERIEFFGEELNGAEEPVLKGTAGIATRPDAAEPSFSDVIVADPAKGAIDIFVPEPPGAPRIDELTKSNITASSFELSALIDPDGNATDYSFRYSPEAVPAASSPCAAPCVEMPAPAGQVGAAGVFGDIAIAAQKVEGLSAFSSYGYKLIAKSAGGTTESPEDHVRTLPTSPSELPDHRGLSVVTPADKNGGYVEAASHNGGAIQAAADGHGIAYLLSTAIAGAKGNNAPELDQILAVRHENADKQEEWTNENLITQSERPNGALPSYVEYKLFSADLSHSIVKPVGTSVSEAPQLSSEASERTVYLHNDQPCTILEAGCFTALVNDTNVTAEEGGHRAPYGGGTISYLDSNPSLAQSVVSSSRTLNGEGQLINEGTNGELGLYEVSGGALKLVNILPDGSVAGNPHLGGYPGVDRDMRNAISTDGSRVIWNDGTHLYMRDMTLGKTLRIDAPEGVAEEPNIAAVYQTASADDGTIFFSDEAKLLPGATAALTKPDLYVCEPEELETATPKCKLSDLTDGAPGGEPGWLQRAVPGAAADGSDVFFVANGALSPPAESGSCIPGALAAFESGHAFSNTCSLYVAKRSAAGTWAPPQFIAKLSLEDEWDWSSSAGQYDLSRMTSRVSPDGLWYAFMSDRGLTGNNTHDAVSGKADEQVYLYDVAAAKVICASCDPGGARPHGVKDIEESGEGIGLLIDRRLTWIERWLAASVPGWTPIDLSHALYQSRYLSDRGRLFFNSSQQLSPRDHNHTQDVYEFEPAGFTGPAGEEVCSTASDTYSESAGGCVALISGGTPVEKESAFLDASEGGDDVFFDTAASLVTQDGDSAFDVYDAGVCGISGAPGCVPQPPPSPPPCESLEKCRAGESNPTLGGEGSGSLVASGSGNTAKSEVLGSTEEKKKETAKPKPLTRAQRYAKAVKTCKKVKNKHKRTACLKQAKKKYGPVSKKANRAVHHTAGAGVR